MGFASALGALPSGLYTTDYQFLSEGARRIALGQAPHRDFAAPIGPLIFWLMATVRHLPSLGPDALAVNALMWAITAPLAGVVAVRLPSGWQAIAFLALTALIVLDPFNLEPVKDACDLNYNGIYNRHGAALLFITFVVGLTRPGSPRADGMLFACLLALMLLTKVTYGFAGIAYLGLASLFSTVRLRAFGIALGLVIASALALELATGVPSAYTRDIAEMARLNTGNILFFVWGGFLGNAVLVLTALALAAALAIEPLRVLISARRKDAAAALRQLELPTLAGACAALTLWAESQSTGGAGLIALSALTFAPGLASERWAPLKLILVGGVVFLTAGLYADQVMRRGRCVLASVDDLRSHAATEALVPGMRVASGRIAAAELTARFWRDHRPLADEAYARGFDFNLESFGAPVSFVANAMIAHDAAERLQALGLSRDLRRVTTLAFVDDFTPLLGLAPAPGLKLVLDPYRTIGALTKDEAAAYLAPIDAAFERTCAAPPFVRQVAGLFRPVLDEAFEAVVLTPCWTVHMRRAMRPPG